MVHKKFRGKSVRSGRGAHFEEFNLVPDSLDVKDHIPLLFPPEMSEQVEMLVLSLIVKTELNCSFSIVAMWELSMTRSFCLRGLKETLDLVLNLM